jgi:peptidyl-prolyl cis-trans isomerase SurA
VDNPLRHRLANSALAANAINVAVLLATVVFVAALISPANVAAGEPTDVGPGAPSVPATTSKKRVAAVPSDEQRRAKLPKGYADVDGIVAVVGRRIITRSALTRALGKHGRSAQMVPTDAERPRNDAAMLRQVLDTLVENELVLSAARELGMTVNDSEIDAQLDKLKKKNLWDLTELRENVRKMGFAGIREYREHVRTEKVRVKMLRTKLGARLRVTEQQVKQILDVKYKGGTIEEEVHSRHILVKVAPSAGPMQINALRSKAWKIHDKVTAPGASFATIAEESSDDVGTEEGGDLGWMRRWMLDPTFARTLWKMKKPGQISAVIQTPFGFHILQYLDRRMVPARDKRYIQQMVRALLTEQQFIKLYRSWIGELRASHHIENRL